MSILITRTKAWQRFLNQFLVTSGNGYLEYRRLLKIDIQLVIDKWLVFVDNQYELDNISEHQHTQWKKHYPLPIQHIQATRRYRGPPTGGRVGNPNWIRAKEERLKEEQRDE